MVRILYCFSFHNFKYVLQIEFYQEGKFLFLHGNFFFKIFIIFKPSLLKVGNNLYYTIVNNFYRSKYDRLFLHRYPFLCIPFFTICHCLFKIHLLLALLAQNSNACLSPTLFLFTLNLIAVH